MKRIFSIAIAIVMVCTTLVGCSSASGSSGGQTPAITDMMGRQVTLPKEPESIVALLASDVEILYAIGAGDQIAGVGEYCNYPAEALGNPVVASGAGTNLEQILA